MFGKINPIQPLRGAAQAALRGAAPAAPAVTAAPAPASASAVLRLRLRIPLGGSLAPWRWEFVQGDAQRKFWNQPLIHDGSDSELW